MIWPRLRQRRTPAWSPFPAAGHPVAQHTAAPPRRSSVLRGPDRGSLDACPASSLGRRGGAGGRDGGAMFDRRVAKTGGYPRVKNSSKSPEVVQELKARIKSASRLARRGRPYISHRPRRPLTCMRRSVRRTYSVETEEARVFGRAGLRESVVEPAVVTAPIAVARVF